jgi:uncharacterized protein (DUF736 family)
MANIGTFTRDENGIYTGTLRTLTVRAKVTIAPIERPARPRRIFG